MSQGRLVLHVGAMKSGTTYLQNRLFDNKATLADRGVLLPAKEWRGQSRIIWGFLYGEGRQWLKKAAEISAHPGLSIVSMEFLAAATPERARAMRESVDVDIDVVITARDLNRSIPAMWQESVQNGWAWTWEHYLAAMPRHRPGLGEQREPSPPADHFWKQQDVAGIARTWGDAVGHDRVTVVTVPPPGAPKGLLWDRFVEVLGIDASGVGEGSSDNESLGAASAQVMRRLNELLDETGLAFPESAVARKRVLSKQVLAAHKAVEPSIGLSVADWVVEESQHQVSALRDLGVRLVGDWADLDPVAVPGIDPTEVPEHEITEAAIAGLSGFLAAVVKDRSVLDR